METNEDENTNNKNGIDSFWIIIIVIFTWVLSWITLDCFIPEQNETRASFGDKFGAVNSLFAALAFAGIIITILLQKQELKLQREELKLQRKEQVATREVFEKQTEMFAQEKFENTFFQMLTFLHSIVDSMEIQNKGQVEQKGRDCFKIFYDSITVNLTTTSDEEKAKKALDAVEKNKTEHFYNLNEYIKAYEDTYICYRSYLSHYFRTLYHIIKLIDTSNVSNKKHYISIARAQLSSYEQTLLFYNCLHKNGSEKFKPLIEKYTLFKNIDGSILLDSSHEEEYNNTAFEYN